MNYLEELREWKNAPTNDKVLINELKKINEKNVSEYFGTTMSFGTAGIRGVLGAGTNKINEFTIAAAAYAFGATMIKQSERVKDMGFVIAHDNRQNGKLFAKVTAQVFKHLGIKTYMFKNNEMAATPLLSYAIRKLRAAAGVNITASHNPKEYNGFKVYNAQGAQLMPEFTSQVSKLMDKIHFLKVPYGQFEPIYINPTLIEDYVSDVLSIRKRPNDVKQLVVVYSPLNGTGSKIAPTLFQKMDIEYYEVKKEMKEDPLFSGLKSCNPEEDVAYKRAIRLARKKNADIIILTDPDADRVGLAIQGPNGKYIKINGNQTGAIVLNHLLRTTKNRSGYIVQSIVSSNITKKMALRNKLNIVETHVGFKNIAEVIRSKPKEFIMGYEESYGQLINPEIARDKDAFQGLVMLVEIANYLKTQNKTLLDEISFMETMYGIHVTSQISKQITDEDLPLLFEYARQVEEIGGYEVVDILDFTEGKINGLEKTNLIKIILDNNSWIAIRPSGTEPKVKFYLESIGKTKKEVNKLLKHMTYRINEFISLLKKGIIPTQRVVIDRTKTIVFEENQISEAKGKDSIVEFTPKNSGKVIHETATKPIVENNKKTQEKELKQKTPKKVVFSTKTISPMPDKQTPSQLDPVEVKKLKNTDNN